MTWEILIASVWARTTSLQALLDHLVPQLEPHAGAVSILLDRDDCEAPVGLKRTRLVEAATADYVCFVDDDDWVANDYVERIVLALHTCPRHGGPGVESHGWYGIKYECSPCLLEGRGPNGAAVGPDAVGFRLAYSHDGARRKDAIHSGRFGHWHEDEHAYYRTINHLNPVRRQLALRCLPFLPGFGEDSDYAGRLAPHLRSEVFLDGEPLYHYRFSPAGSLFTSGARRVGADPGLRLAEGVRVMSHDGGADVRGIA